MSHRRLAALVLAAGGSTRLGQPKQLVRYAGEQLIDRAIRIAQEAGADPVFVVLGANFELIVASLATDEPPVRILFNKAWHNGMAGSVALGAASAERVGAEELLVMACDQPSVTTSHLLRLQAAARPKHVVASTYAGRRGVPALFPDFAFHALQELDGDGGARGLLQRSEVLTVPLVRGEIDIDTPEDLRELAGLEGESNAPARELIA